ERPHAALRTLGSEATAGEDGDQCFEHLSMTLVLVDVEDRMQLPPARRPSVRVPVDRDREATFSVDEPRHPTRIEIEHRPDGFLLIVRTGWIFTAHGHILSRGCDVERVPPDTRRFQHIARFSNGLSRLTVIVTAAVYRGLGSELRLAANPSP